MANVIFVSAQGPNPSFFLFFDFYSTWGPVGTRIWQCKIIAKKLLKIGGNSELLIAKESLAALFCGDSLNLEANSYYVVWNLSTDLEIFH